MSEFLTIADLEKAARELPTETIEIKGLGKKVTLRALSDGAVDELVKGLPEQDEDTGVVRRAWIVACSVTPKLTNKHLELLSRVSSDITLKIWEVVRRLNGLDASAEEETRKNS